MCGIIGFLNINVEDERYLEIASHRGPDDKGVYIGKNIILGHNRLSILDLSENGHQPFISKDDKFILVFNGEIYNHWEIRKELRNLGYNFNSTSDTETLLNGYRHFGKGILNKLNGIFSFAIFDKEKNQLFIARDHFGVKPLYYYHKHEQFAFASEFKTIWSTNFFDIELNKNALPNYLNFLWSPGQNTPFKYLKKLLPGHYICLDLEDPNIVAQPQKYYEIPFIGKYSHESENELIDKLDILLQNAVKRQLLSDVPVGFFLSGGLDSSLLVAIARKLSPEKKIQAFTIRVDIDKGDEGFVDDLYYAKKVAKAVVKEKSKGILFCGSGQGMCMAANKVKGIRAGVVINLREARLIREHNDANVVCLSGWEVKDQSAYRIINMFLKTNFSKAARHKRRVNKIKRMER